MSDAPDTAPPDLEAAQLLLQVERLFAPLRALLDAHPQGLSEHQLFGLLAGAGQQQFGARAFADNLSLFQSHFLLFHTLYRLRDRLRQQGAFDLEIGCLRIALLPLISGQAAGTVVADPLRAYYLDLSHLLATGAQEVAAMLDALWGRLAQHDKREGALGVLGLSDPVDDQRIKSAYRHLALRHHPDRGGDGKKLRELNAAMAVLLPRPKANDR